MAIGDPIMQSYGYGDTGDWHCEDETYWCHTCWNEYDRLTDVEFCVRLHRIEDALTSQAYTRTLDGD